MECTLKICSPTTRNNHVYEWKKISMQLWRSRVPCQSRSKYAVKRLVITLERTRFSSNSIHFCYEPTWRNSWVVSISAYQPYGYGFGSHPHNGISLILFRGSCKWNRRLSIIVKYLLTSVAEWLAFLRYQWWCLDSVRGSWFKSRSNAARSLAKSRRSLESGRMGNTSPATGPLRRNSTWPQIWRIARQEVALKTPLPVRSGKLREGLTTGSFCIF